MEFSRQEYWSGLPFPTPRDLPDPGIEPASLASPPLAGRFFIILLQVLRLQELVMDREAWHAVVHQAPLSMEFSGKEYWSGLPFPTPGDLPDSGIEPVSPALIGIGRWILYH